MQIEDSEIAIQLEQAAMRYAEKAGLTATKPQETFREISNSISDSLSDLATSDNEEDAEHQDYDEEDTELGKRREDGNSSG